MVLYFRLCLGIETNIVFPVVCYYGWRWQEWTEQCLQNHQRIIIVSTP